MADKRKLNKSDIESQLVSVQTELKNGVFTFTGPMTIGEFASKVSLSPNKIIWHYFSNGKMFNINQTLNEEQIAELCIEYGFDFQKENEITAQNFMEQIKIQDKNEDLKPRPPIITIMGHVDHGKTTLIDKIRNSNIANGEAGGITQHIGAYQIEYNGKLITFLDTPGHEAFTAMRARGAKLTDIVVLVVAADDGVMPQTKEAIDHAKAASVPIIVFINKIDKPGADIEKIKGDLSKLDLVSDEWGGSVQFVRGSGLTGEGIQELFEAINLEAEVLELKANPNRLPIGTVVESRLDKGRGSTSTLIIEHGTLYSKDFIVAGSKYGRIRTLENSLGQKIEVALPGDPVIITGLNYTPNAGDKFFGFKDEKFAKKLADEKEFADKQQELKERTLIKVKEGVKIINIIIKSDVQGTAEAVKHSLATINNEEAQVNVVRASVGEITKNDILLAQASNAIVYSFNVKPSMDIKNYANEKKVELSTHTIIYKMIEEVEAIIHGLKAPKFEEKYLGECLVLKTFFYSKIGTIAGSRVIDGLIKSDSIVKVFRRGKMIHEGKLDSLQRELNPAKQVDKGKEFGCHIKKFDDIQMDDVIKAYEVVEVK